MLAQKKIELQQRRGQQKQLKKQLGDAKYRVRELRRDVRLQEQAQIILQKVAQLTQQELEFRISDIVSLALASVFPNPYKLVVEFVIRRNKTEADLWLERNGQRVHPMDATGGGVVDIAAVTLRIVLWSLQQPRPRATLILDEPFPHLSVDLQPKAHEVLSTISKELGIQIIMVSHVEDAVESADKVFKFVQRNGVTRIKEE